jgi:hypothetical protein
VADVVRSGGPPRSVDGTRIVISEYRSRAWLQVVCVGAVGLALSLRLIIRQGFGGPESSLIVTTVLMRVGVLMGGEVLHVQHGSNPVKAEIAAISDRRIRKTISAPAWLRDAHAGQQIDLVVDAQKNKIMLALDPHPKGLRTSALM